MKQKLFCRRWLRKQRLCSPGPARIAAGRTSLCFLKVVFCLLLLSLAWAGDWASAQPALLPWETAPRLRELAQSAFLESTLNPTNPQPDCEAWPQGPSMQLSSLKMRNTIWGPPNRVTLSLTKNNVWDRRLPRCQWPTLQQVVAGAEALANAGLTNPRQNQSSRPVSLGYLKVEGGYFDPLRSRAPKGFPFPGLKPVGQIIVGLDALAGAPAPRVLQRCDNGLVCLRAEKGQARARLEFVLGMQSNLFAIRGQLEGLTTQPWLRLYRHRDTAQLSLATTNSTASAVSALEAEADWCSLLPAPQSGQGGRYFWIRQQLPPEKTFPEGFQYVLMGVMLAPGKVTLQTLDGQAHLGTPPPEAAIAAATGSAATATFTPSSDGRFEALVTVVTTQDNPDIMAEARQRLSAAELEGFAGVLRENTRWWNDFYDRREHGRVFAPGTNAFPGEDIPSLYRSWTCHHGGGTRTDMRQLECSAHYVVPEKDVPPWHSAPCYNEIFYTYYQVHNWGDGVEMWKQIAEHWAGAGRLHAQETFGLPGMYLAHGYLPPVKPDRYVHTTVALELCLATCAQLLRPVWDEWDYGGDTAFLRETCYPLMKQMALFYAAYAKKGEDGYYHFIPAMQEECWGIYPGFARNRDVLSTLCLARWALLRTADAAELLNVDADLRRQWRELAARIAPYPTWNKPQGEVFAGIPGVEPVRFPGDHPWDIGVYPATLADEINLDSPPEQKERIVRTAQLLPSAGSREALLLMAATQVEPRPQSAAQGSPGRNAEALLNSRSGRIHLFPAVAQGTEVAFKDFQARGGFRISAARNQRGVTFVQVTSRRDNQCRLMNPWPGKPVLVRELGQTIPVPVQVDSSNGECLRFQTRAGHTYRLSLDSPAPASRAQ